MSTTAGTETQTELVDAPERSLRRDAERNRRRILSAARVVLAERGLRGSYDDIAREAEVGVGTVYRRFPDRQQLIEALFEEGLEEVVAFAQEGLAIEDPWDGLIHFILGVQERQCADRALRELLLAPDDGPSRIARARAQLSPKLDRLIDRAKAAGVVREDISATDIWIMQLAVCTIADIVRDNAPDAWRRTLDIMLDGIQPTRDAVRPMTVPALSHDQIEAAVAASANVRR
jgi:AcrR family transcriptional regulator